MSTQKQIHWSPPGPVSAAFMASNADVQLLNGPIGSGKTSTVLIKGIQIAGRQRPSTLDDIRKFKLCVVRDTYRQLWKTTIPSWWEWVPKGKGEWTGAKDGPAVHKLKIPQPDGTILHYQVDFVAIGENSAESVMRGYQPTAFYLNELDMLSQDALTYAAGRAGRYPPRREGGCSWYGILGDFNAPELDSWLHEMVLDTPEGVEIFRQPGGRDKNAENLHNLEPDYYDRQIRINRKDPQYIKRMVDNEPGYSRAGKPVFQNFNDHLHVAQKPLEYFPGLRLEVGLDAGLHPSAVFLQILPNGQKRIIGELYAGRLGPTNFSRLLVDHIKLEYPQAQWEKIRCYCDPSAADGGDGEDQSWLDKVRQQTGLRIQPAFSNSLTARLDPISESLLRLIDGFEPEFLLSTVCKLLRKGFNGGYKYAKIAGSNARFSDKPEKNDSSHPMDALQYVVMSVKGSTAVSTWVNKRRKGILEHRTAILNADGSDMKPANYHQLRKASM